jgi:hypothetical protein
MALSQSRTYNGVPYAQIFLREVLGRLLHEFDAGQPLANCRDVIHSWDLCGEPEAFLPHQRQSIDAEHPVMPDDMNAFLNDGIRLVQDVHSFPATIGFRFLRSASSSALRPHMRQFHTYDGEVLPIVTAGDASIIGEAATTEISPFDPQIGFRNPSIIDRLQWFEAKGYREVFLWAGGCGAPDARYNWNRSTQDQIRLYTNASYPNRFRPINEYLARTRPLTPSL